MLYIINDTYIANALYSEIHLQSVSNYTVHEATVSAFIVQFIYFIFIYNVLVP